MICRARYRSLSTTASINSLSSMTSEWIAHQTLFLPHWQPAGMLVLSTCQHLSASAVTFTRFDKFMLPLGRYVCRTYPGLIGFRCGSPLHSQTRPHERGSIIFTSWAGTTCAAMLVTHNYCIVLGRLQSFPGNSRDRRNHRGASAAPAAGGLSMARTAGDLLMHRPPPCFRLFVWCPPQWPRSSTVFSPSFLPKSNRSCRCGCGQTIGATRSQRRRFSGSCRAISSMTDSAWEQRGADIKLPSRNLKSGATNVHWEIEKCKTTMIVQTTMILLGISLSPPARATIGSAAVSIALFALKLRGQPRFGLRFRA